MTAKFSKGGKGSNAEGGAEKSVTNNDAASTKSCNTIATSKAVSEDEEDLPLVRVRQEKVL